MEKEIKIEVVTRKYSTRTVDIEFPFYIKRNYPSYEGISYIRYSDERNTLSITVPKNIEGKFSKSYFYIETDHQYEGDYKYAFKNGSVDDKNYYELSSKQEFEAALQLYKDNFLNKI